ncbi:Metal-dependent hydrolase YbeY, involved in rRNA and/or ribosome maturation and assembly [hydrothermal vent metagenome]|uniref:Metal-dependent hydrolase YbeY, involved in rRNA and/or ribosome maturation and assembly n=1 Tax=hydrothermal vent metagenome TaxID=652676 RepID=A0A3B1B0K9_9ZZZZ
MIPENIDIDISCQSELWTEYCSEYTGLMESCFAQIIKLVPEAEFFKIFPHLELSILLTDDQNIRQLNKEYRGRDKATNVLSFPSLSYDDIQNHQRPDCEIPEYPVVLGDIIFAFETIRGEASAQNKSFSDHFCHLFIHGMLHLLGYDHAVDIEAQGMEALEKELLLKLSIDDPYQD